MGRRTAPSNQDQSTYKYKGDKDAGIRPHEQCEMNEDHIVRPTSWPPVRKGYEVGEPTMSLQCELCGVNVVVYAGHANGEMEGVKVIVPEVKKVRVPA